MDDNNNTKLLSRLTAILTILQTKRLLTASELANKFSVSNRTIYRDIKALEQAGVPILTEDGKGYSLMKGLIVNKWIEIWKMNLERVFTADFEVFGEKSQNPTDAEIDFLIAVK